MIKWIFFWYTLLRIIIAMILYLILHHRGKPVKQLFCGLHYKCVMILIYECSHGDLYYNFVMIVIYASS